MVASHESDIHDVFYRSNLTFVDVDLLVVLHISMYRKSSSKASLHDHPLPAVVVPLFFSTGDLGYTLLHIGECFSAVLYSAAEQLEKYES